MQPTTTRHDNSTGSPEGLSGAAVRAVVRVLLIAAVLLLVVRFYHAATRPFDYPDAWISADVATMARTYAQVGVIAMHGLQVHNNPPIIASKQAYVHWPPLYPMVLSLVFRLFGSTVPVAHIFQCLLMLATAGAIYWVVKGELGPIAAAAAVFVWTCLPVIGNYMHVVLHLNMAMLGMWVTLGFLLRAVEAPQSRFWKWGGVAIMAAATMSSWEPLLMPVGVVIYGTAAKDSRTRRLGALYFAAACLTFAAVMTLYLTQAPTLALDLKHTLLYRLRLSKMLPADGASEEAMVNARYYGRAGQLSMRQVPEQYYHRFMNNLGPAALALLAAGCIWSWRRRNRRGLAMLCGLAAPWVLWYGVFHNHAALHDYEMLIAAPVTAAAGGDALAWIACGGRWWQRGAFAAAVGLLLFPAAYRAWTGPVVEADSGTAIAFAGQLRRATPEGSIVVTSFDSSVPLFYCQRHLIRSVYDDADMDSILPRVAEDYPGRPVYLAIPRKLRERYAGSLGATPQIVRDEDSLFLARLR